MKRRLLLLAIFLLHSLLGRELLYAQKVGQARIDSLLTEVYKAKEDTNKVNLLNIIASAYLQINPDSAEQIANKAIKLATQLEYKKGEGTAKNILGNKFTNEGKYNEAITDYNEALKIRQAIGDKKGMGGVYCNIGTVYANLNDLAKTLDNYFAALKILEEIGDKPFMARVLNNIGIIYVKQNNFTEGLKNYRAALAIKESIKDEDGIASAQNNIGCLYMTMNQYDVALKYIDTSLNIYQKINSKGGLATAYLSLSSIYTQQGNYTEALKCLNTGLYISEELKNTNNIIVYDKTIGVAYLRQKKYLLAEEYMNKALTLAIASGKYAPAGEEYETLSQIYEQTGQYEKALKSYKAYTATQDSIYNKENTKKLVQSQMQYDFGKKEDSTKTEQDKKDLLAKSEIIKQKRDKRFFMAGGVLMFLIAGGAIYFLIYTRRSKREIEAQKNRAERSERFKQQFLANMSHEIRTPMNAVSGMTDLLLETGPRTDQVEYLQAISKSSEILLHIINDILDLSKIEAGKLELESIDFSLAETIKQVKDVLSYKAEEKGLQLITNIDSDVTDVLTGDPYRLNQILVNLGSNAIKFTQRGSVLIEVKRISEEGGNIALRFSVTDTGMGIPQGKLQSLFESFTQVNSSDTRKFGGTGLGLSISKQLVELQGGNISVESKEGSGSTFSFTIAYPAGSAEKLQQRIAQERKVDGSILNGLRILLADDNEYNRLVVNETLRLKANLHIDLVTNGQEAIQMLQENDYDVILMDVQMPVMNGIDATIYIRKQMPESKNKVPIIALTASILRADLDMCSESGMNSYVPKPFKAWQLIHTIADVTGRKPVERYTDKTPITSERIVARGTDTVTGLAYLRTFCEGDEERIKRYITLYLQAVPAFRKKLLTAIDANDLAEILLLLHSFKPKWMMMGMKNTRELAIKIDLVAIEQKDTIYELAKQVIEQTDRSVVELADKT